MSIMRWSLLSLALVVLIAGCGDGSLSPEEEILGTWRLDRQNDVPVNYSLTIRFSSDGTYVLLNDTRPDFPLENNGTWQISGRQLIVNDTFFFDYSIVDDELITIAQGSQFIVVYKRASGP